MWVIKYIHLNTSTGLVEEWSLYFSRFHHGTDLIWDSIENAHLFYSARNAQQFVKDHLEHRGRVVKYDGEV